MSRILVLALAVSLLASSACFRTRYVQLAPREPGEPAATYLPEKKNGGWQSFFLWGWVPGTRKIDAEAMCGGTRRIESIRTRRTFLEGLVAALAGYYVNIYSPYDGAVYCRPPPTP